MTTENKRLVELRKKITSLQDLEKKLIEELQSREEDWRFAKAKELFDSGWRLVNWGAALTDTDESISLFQEKKEVGYWADGTSRDTDQAFALIGIEEDEDGETILEFLSDLTEEE